MGYLTMFRTGKAPRKVAESTVDKRIAEIRAKGARVNRDALVRFIFGGEFAALPETRQSIIDNPVRRREEAVGWIIPESCLGRVGVPSASVAESIRLWIKKNVGIESETFSIIYVPDEN